MFVGDVLIQSFNGADSGCDECLLVLARWDGVCTWDEFQKGKKDE